MEYLRFGLALLFVLGLICACSWFGKRMGLAPRSTSGKGAGQRLTIIEVRAVDAKRKLLLVRRDHVEHLILLNGDRDLLIEGGIESASAHTEKPFPPIRPVTSLGRLAPVNGNMQS